VLIGQRLQIKPGQLPLDKKARPEMKISIPKYVPSTREAAPRGRYKGICVAIVDRGTMTGVYQGRPTIGRKVQVTFELPEVGNSKTGNPLTVHQLYTASMHPKAKLRKDIENWKGKAMSDDEANEFEFSWMLGRHCLVDVGQNVKDDSVYATVERILPLAEGTTLPQAVNDPVFFSLDDPDLNVFALLSKTVQAAIQITPEWAALPFANDWRAQYNADVAANEPAF
jgi:hypothetical protein